MGISALGMLLTWCSGSAWLAMGGIFLIGLGFAPMYPAMLHTTPSYFGAELSQQVMGVEMALAYVGSTFFPPLFGMLAAPLGTYIYPGFLLICLLLAVTATELTDRLLKSENPMANAVEKWYNLKQVSSEEGFPLKKRETMILELLSQHGKMEVTSLAEQVGVSQVTIRKDLDALESRGILRREHGYACFGGNDDINNRLAFHYEEKRLIAREAAKLVSPGETVMIENGSCCALLAEEIAKTKPGAKIITNSAFIASYIRKVNGIHVVLLGGDFQNDAQVMVGPILRVCVSQFYVDKLFVGTDGYSPDRGFTNNDHLRVQAVRDMAEHASQVVVVTESVKFSHQSVVPMGLDNRISAVVTDAQMPDEAEAALCAKGVRVFKAALREKDNEA